MPRHNLYKVTPLVRELCKKYNIEFQNKPILTAFFDIVRWVYIVRIYWTHAGLP